MNTGAIIMSESHLLRCELAAEVLRSSGTLRLRVTGWSMLPTVWPGDTLIVERVDSADVLEGEIVLFSRKRRLVAHRVLKNQGSAMSTRGDSMMTADSPVHKNELLGRVQSIVRNGRPIEPRRTLGAGERAIASIVQRSEFAAGIVMRVHGLLQTSDQTV